MKFIHFLWDISWRNIVLATIAGLISGCGNSMLISLINHSVNQAAFPNALFYFAGLGLFILVTSTVSQFMLIHLSQNAIYQLRVRLSQNILSAPLQHLEHLGNHRLLATMTDDVRSLSHAVSSIPNLCIDLATVIGCLTYLAWLSSTIFTLTVVFTALTIWFVQFRLGKARYLFTAAREKEDTLLQHFQAIITGSKELKLHRHRRDDFMDQNLMGTAKNLRSKNSKAMQSFALANGLGQLSQFMSLGFTLFILPGLMHIPLPMLSTYVLTSTFLALPMQNLLGRLPDIIRGNIALEKIERMKLSLASQSEVENGQTFPINQHCDIELDHVTYLYHPEHGESGPPPHGEHDREPNRKHDREPSREHKGDRKDKRNGPPPFEQNGHPPHHPPGMDENGFLLGPISLSLKPGTITYIVGGNGSGKSTLAKLITGLYVPKTGSIYLDGTGITDYNREWYRQHFSAIFTDFHLFDSYLGLQRKDLDREVQRYLSQLKLDHKVQVKDGVLSTTRLSQGQKKRLALLTMYLEDRPVYLFDEWASDQEPLFRELFYREILINLKERGKTVIVITHDDRYFHLADHFIKLDYGTVELDQIPTLVT
jgi:putative pyoverdin transport system ATP-binding/permease protein